MRAYSKRPDIADALVKAVQHLRQAEEHTANQPMSVRSAGRSKRRWRVADRLTKADVQRLVEAFQGGTPKWKLAEQYGISASSVQRLVRKHRSA